MAEFSLPANSKVRKDGRQFKAPAGAKNVVFSRSTASIPNWARTRASTATRSIWTIAVRWCWML